MDPTNYNRINGAPQEPVQLGSTPPEFPVIGLPMHFQITQMEINSGPDGGSSMGILLAIHSPVGINKFLMPAADAVNLFTQALAMANAAKAGIILPGHGNQ